MESEVRADDHSTDNTFPETDSNWNYLPDSILLHIFQYLSARELLDVGLTCRSWFRVSYDEFLWKDLFYYNFKIDPSVKIVPGKYFFFSFRYMFGGSFTSGCASLLVKEAFIKTLFFNSLYVVLFISKIKFDGSSGYMTLSI
jgi:hypothetical protein